MKVRAPKINLRAPTVHWCPNLEFGHIINAGSTSLPAVETYLNRVMAMARNRLDADDKVLRDAITLFIAQESAHYRQHRVFNRKLDEAGYDGMRLLEEQLKFDYVEFLRKRSLRFNAAYCEGFESLGIIYAAFFFEGSDEYLKNADPAVTELWKWHFAEEFEHRSVCHDVYRTLFGGYFYRIYGLCYALIHLGRYGAAVSRHLLETDRAGMSEADRRVSIVSERKVRRCQARFMLLHVLRIFSPFYDPANRPAPKGSGAVLAAIEARTGRIVAAGP